MAILDCVNQTDVSGRELLEHGDALFPIACYYDDLLRASVLWHWHDEFEAAVVTEGRAELVIGERREIVRAGEGFFINAGVLHSAAACGAQGARFHSMCFHPRLLGGADGVVRQKYLQPLIANGALQGLILRRDVPWQARALDDIEAAWRECRDDLYGGELRVQRALTDLIEGVVCSAEALRPRPSAGNPREAERVKRMLRFVHARCADAIGVADIAAAAAVSVSECLRCFKAVIGVPPIRYLRQYRLERAAELLRATDLKIARVAEQCGFQDMSYFAREFARRFGCAPSQYRRRLPSAAPAPRGD